MASRETEYHLFCNIQIVRVAERATTQGAATSLVAILGYRSGLFDTRLFWH